MSSFDLLRHKMDEAKAHHVRLLNQQLFTSIPLKPVAPPTWRERVRGYFAVLWAAVRGRADLYRDEDWD